MTVQDIIDHFGSVAALAEFTKANRFTVYTWRRQGAIPAKYDLALVAEVPGLTLLEMAMMRARARQAA